MLYLFLFCVSHWNWTDLIYCVWRWCTVSSASTVCGRWSGPQSRCRVCSVCFLPAFRLPTLQTQRSNPTATSSSWRGSRWGCTHSHNKMRRGILEGSLLSFFCFFFWMNAFYLVDSNLLAFNAHHREIMHKEIIHNNCMQNLITFGYLLSVCSQSCQCY